MDLQLDGKTVFITGASGGIGRALARAFADEACNLILHAHSNMAWLEEFIADAEWRDRAVAVAVKADITDPDAVQTAFDEGAKRFGRIDVCVANAGQWPKPDEPLHAMPVERFRNTINVNLLGAAWTARSFMRQLKRREDGHGASLTFIGSTAGRFGEANHSDYAAGKSAMTGLMNSLKNEVVQLDPFARVNVVEPGWTVTEMARAALDEPGRITKIAKTMSLRQLARAKDIAHSAVLLSSPGASRHITGQVVTVAGGMEGRTLWDEHEINEEAIRRRMRE